MTTAIIIGVLIAVCIVSLKSYLKKLTRGCCGAGGDTEEQTQCKTDLSRFKYKYTFNIGGMSCKNCALRIENVLNKQEGVYSHIDYKSGAGELFSESPVSEFAIRRSIVELGYSVERIEENEPAERIASAFDAHDS